MWHTHLKKRLNPNQTYKESKRRSRGYAKCKKEPSKTEVQGHKPPPVCSHSDASSTADARKNCVLGTTNSLEWLPKIDDALWSGGLTGNKDSNLVEQEASISKKFDSWSSSGEDVMSFWINMLAEAGNLA
ncbi:hypothetical protein HPP92_027551 [Vanilla planifolia]|uniref:Uncharacterized protein n=1 Tax=Vanilla planifolia TaxID=51239 RepID=A0A835U5D7_VANPL|nr:hypothetical protein HPP92_027551 [Vanilla planifolia]KAG0460724.1 hypothetical protein HPP92_021021 [Vanilla planifolia]